MPEYWFFLHGLSDEIGGSYTGEHDRYGDSCDLLVFAVRIGKVALLLIPEGEESGSIYGPFPLDEAADRAREIHAQYDMGDLRLTRSPADLEDRYEAVADVLTRAYRPHPKIRPGAPRDIIAAIAGHGETEKPGVWAWIDNTLYLSSCYGKRTGVTRGVYVFDENLTSLFRAIGVRVDQIMVRASDRFATWSEAVLAALAERRRQEVVTRLEKVTHQIEMHRREIGKLQVEIAKAEEEKSRIEGEMEGLGD